MEIQFVFLGSKIQRFNSQKMSLFYRWRQALMPLILYKL